MNEDETDNNIYDDNINITELQEDNKSNNKLDNQSFGKFGDIESITKDKNMIFSKRKILNNVTFKEKTNNLDNILNDMNSVNNDNNLSQIKEEEEKYPEILIRGNTLNENVKELQSINLENTGNINRNILQTQIEEINNIEKNNIKDLGE